MFCAKCGNKLHDGEKFCAVCGTGINSGAGDTLRAMRDVLEKHRKHAQVFAVFLSVFIITCFFLGWISIQIRPGVLVPKDSFIMGFAPKEITNMLYSDINLTITLYDLGNYARGLDSVSTVIERSGAGVVPNDVFTALRPAADTLGSASIVIIAIMICVLAFAVFFSLMTAGSKKAALAGQAATLLSFVIPLVFAISVSAINSRLASGSYPVIKISASKWVYITMILSAADFLLITVCKMGARD